MNRSTFNQYLTFAQFAEFFNELGWDRAGSQLDSAITVDDTDYEFKAVSQKRGFIIYVAEVDAIPQNAQCRKIDIKLRRYSNDYILIFTKPGSEHHLWITPVKTVEKRDLVTIEYQNPAQAEFLFSKLNDISFEIAEEVTIVDVTTRIHKAFEVNAGKITKDFYAGFKQQHKSFANFIQGIDVEGDKQWYASVMLNRLMFCYFIQKKGFLNFDEHYLRNKLKWSQEQQGENQFFSSFYKGFLTVLFRGGLNNPTHDLDFEKTYGRIPYLNGGMFDEHQLEKQYEDIDIDDKAFENLFDFFDKWRWHLDTRITATGKDINPDVLGYIFEQYINDRAQMGAYYTKEDITEYIGKNCIIPFLMDEVAKTSSGKHFTPNGYVWQTVKNSGNHYIYNAVKKGIDLPLPEFIAKGIDTTQPNLLERRSRWNEPAYEQHALPTEIWRETVERRQRCKELINKISAGEITHINDFTTYNLDIRTFVQDLLDKAKDHLFVLHFYRALQRITILDPTCGSGAFLFAALNILEPLYEICIARMEEFNRENPNLFKDELAEITNKYRSNIQHFIYKSIILRNLYGVDIMVEATEIAKLRLFLKMVAVVDVNRRADNLGLDPLPDIDFNIRCGNTLVGYATENELNKDLSHAKDIYEQLANNELKDEIEENMEKVAMAYEVFKKIQLEQHIDMVEFKKAKSVLNLKLKVLNNTLNKRLHTATTTLPYDKWLASHQPFHWLAEFYQIIKGNGGFDVIVGNPPYVEYGTKLKSVYTLRDYDTLECGNLHAYIAERGLKIISINGYLGLIIPLPSISTSRMVDLQKIIKPNDNNDRSVWISAFDERPSSLFDGVDQRLIIEILSAKVEIPLLSTTGINRWSSATRFNLFFNLNYAVQENNNLKYGNSILKIKNNKYESSILRKFYLNKSILNFKSDTITKNLIYYRTAGGRYWK
ncbi:MAG: SAM-dependent methyltransferase, partial [Paludibacter sp.]|nr:SAM-dependent methyltransferase [Paludibacter sp.]